MKKCEIITLSIESLNNSAKIYAKLRNRGIIIGTPDLLICGIALANDLQLISNNEKHFQQIEGLSFGNWKI